MHFILAPGTIAQFAHLRTLYEAKRAVDLSVDPSLIGIPCFFGGTNVLLRREQITFLEKIYAVLKMHLLEEKEIKTPQQRQVYLIAARCMIASCLYVLSQINRSKRNSALYRIIEDNLGITSDNFLDDEDKEICYFTAQRLVNTPSAFEHANTALHKKGMSPLTEKEWSQFTAFLKDMCPKKESKDHYLSFPVTSITQPLFGAAFSYVGATVGVVLAEGVSNSTSAISPRVQLTALVGSTLLILSPAGTTGVALFAPVIATKLLNSFCTISLGHIMGTAAEFLGKGIGIGIGLPFDAAYNLLWSVCSLISRYYSKVPHLAPITGTSIYNGATIIAGIPVQLVAEDAFPEGCTKKIVEISEDGEIRIEGEKVVDDGTPMQIPTEVLKELKKQELSGTLNLETSKVKEDTESKKVKVLDPKETGFALI